MEPQQYSHTDDLVAITIITIITIVTDDLVVCTRNHIHVQGVEKTTCGWQLSQMQTVEI